MSPLRPIIRRLLWHPRTVCVVDDQRAWKSIELYIGALHVARAIARATDRPHVGLMLPTSGLFPMSLIATWMLGRTAVPLNYLLKKDDLEYVINDAELDAVITVKPMLEFVGGEGGPDTALPANVKAIKLDEMKFKGFPPLRRARKMRDDALAVLLYTSGTSGKPKGVMLSASNLSSNVMQCVEWVGFSINDTLLGVLPQFHSFGLTVLTLLPLSVGAKVVYTAKFNPRKLLDLMREHRPTAFIAIPSMLAALLHAKSADADHFRTIKYLVSGGEPLPEAIFQGFRERFGATINEGYGLTETSPVTNWCRPHEYRHKSVGKPLPNIDQIIVPMDANEGIEASSHRGIKGETPGIKKYGPSIPGSLDASMPQPDGEIRMRGPNIMQGYYKLPDATKATFDDNGYFRTGDMGRFDADGFLYITGRIKEMLIIGGENVFPREIEEVLDKHPTVAASAVIGVMDESRGEVAVAFVELKEGAAFDEMALRKHCREALAQFKVPRDIRLIDKLPRNPTGKIMRRELKGLV